MVIEFYGWLCVAKWREGIYTRRQDVILDVHLESQVEKAAVSAIRRLHKVKGKVTISNIVGVDSTMI